MADWKRWVTTPHPVHKVPLLFSASPVCRRVVSRIKQLLDQFFRGRLANHRFIIAGGINGYVVHSTTGANLLCVVALVVTVSNGFIDTLIEANSARDCIASVALGCSCTRIRGILSSSAACGVKVANGLASSRWSRAHSHSNSSNTR